MSDDTSYIPRGPFHRVGLDLGHRKGDRVRPAVTIDGVPLYNVTDVKLDAPARGVYTVTVSFLAYKVVGTRDPLDPDEGDEAYIRAPVTNGG